MPMTQVVLQLARNPGFPNGDAGQGYIINAPLDRDGRLSVDEWREVRGQCSVIRFKPGEERDADGLLTHRGANWYFHYDEVEEGDDEPVYRLGDHTLSVGSYLTIHESDGIDLTYQVVRHLPLKQGASPASTKKETRS